LTPVTLFLSRASARLRLNFQICAFVKTPWHDASRLTADMSGDSARQTISLAH
jgi:hypothetical protein